MRLKNKYPGNWGQIHVNQMNEFIKQISLSSSGLKMETMYFLNLEAENQGMLELTDLICLDICIDISNLRNVTWALINFNKSRFCYKEKKSNNNLIL